MIRVAIAEDHPEMRVALRLLLKLSSGIDLVGEMSNGREAVECVRQIQPDVLVMDINMPVLNGLEATKQIVDLGVPTRVILISSDGRPSMAMQAIAVGAKSFVPKDQLAKLLLPAIEAVDRGEVYF